MSHSVFIHAWLAVTPLLFGCAPRTVPAVFPATSAASEAAPEAKTAVVTTALDGDPPLPGEATGEWHGLASPAAPSGHGAGHEHHHGPPKETPKNQ